MTETKKTDNSFDYDSTEHVDILENGEVYDEGDQAQYLQLRSIADAQIKARNALNKKLSPHFDGVHCVECGDAIDPQRLKNSRTDTCFDCQSYLEERAKRAR